MAVDSTSFNPYAMQYGLNAQSGLSDDFMWNAYLANSQKQSGTQTPTFQGSNLSGQPSTDCYQSSGSSGLSTGLKLGLAGGAGVGLGMYYLGGDKVSPYVNKEWNDAFLKTIETDTKVVEEAEKLRLSEISKRLGLPGGNTIYKEQYSALEEFSRTGTWPDAVTRPSGLESITKEQAQEFVKKVNEEVKPEKLKLEAARTHSFAGSSEYLSQLRVQESLIDGMKDADSLEKLIKDNAKAFGIEATEEAKINEEVQKIISKYGSNKADALNHLRENVIKPQETIVTNLRKGLANTATSYWNEAGNCAREGATKEFKNAVSKFKFTKAGKAGLIAAGVGLVLGWMFGGKS